MSSTNSPVVSLELIQQWEAELKRQREVMSVAQNAIFALARMIESGKSLLGDAASDAPTAPPPAPVARQGPRSRSLYDAIVKIVDEALVPLTPKEIRAAIAKTSDASLITSENYLYTAIKRAADKGQIIKGEHGYEPGPLS